MRKTMQLEPEKWETRVVTRFLLVSKILFRSDGVSERRWLENARILQRLEPYQHRCGAPCFWEDIAWADE